MRTHDGDQLNSMFYRQKAKLTQEMRTEAAAAIIMLEGIFTEAAADLEPSDFGRFERQADGSILFSWRGSNILRFGFKPHRTVGQGLELTVDRLFQSAPNK